MKDDYLVLRIMFLVAGIVELLLVFNAFDLGSSIAVTGFGGFVSGVYFTIFMVLELQAREKVPKPSVETEP